MFRKLVLICRSFAAQLTRDNISAYAASIAFFLFLSLIPMLMLICSIIPYTSVSEADLMRVLRDILPQSMESFVVAQVAYVYDKTPAVLSIAAVVTVWSAAKGVLALMRGLNAVNGVTQEKNYILLRMEACFYTVIIMAVMVLSLTFMVFGNVIKGMVLLRIPQLEVILDIFAAFRFLFTWFILTIVFALLYTWIPNKKMKLWYQVPGAAFAAVSWGGFSYCFSIYVDKFNGFGMYGSLTTIAIVMFWLYCCMYIVMIGANMNRYFKPVIKVFVQGDY